MGDDDGVVNFEGMPPFSPEEAAAWEREHLMVEATRRISSTRNLFENSGLKIVGEGSAHLDEIARLLLQSDMLDESGGVLNSPEASLNPQTKNDVYFLGLNPGGAAPADEKGRITEGTTTIYESLAMCRLGVCGWDQNWSRKDASYRPGEAPLQRRFKHVARRLGIPYPEILATNLIFVRSSRFRELSSVEDQIQACLPVHKLMMNVIRPKRLWVMGNPAHAHDVLNLSNVEWRQANHGNWSIGTGTVEFCGRELRFCHTPHLSLWDATKDDNQELLDFSFGT